MWFEGVRTLCGAILDAIMPPRERSLRTKERSIGDIPLELAVHELLNSQITTIMDYRNGVVRDLIHSLKYDGSRYAAHLAATALSEYLSEEIASIRAFSPHPILLVPIPLHKSRLRERGYNQIELVLRGLPDEFRDGTLSRVETDLLFRSHETGPQTRLHRAARITNVARAFEVNKEASSGKANIFLIDDVTTTGATLVEAAKPLRKMGAKVYLLALARA